MSLSSARYGIVIGLLANALLLILKASASGISDSLTIFSETLNSLSDFLGAIVIFVFVRWAHRTVDEDHPFGHHRAEPIAGLVLGLFSGILGIEVVRHAVIDLSRGNSAHHIGPWPALALITAIGVKGALAIYFSRLSDQLGSPAFRASAVDCRNDVFVGSQALVGVLLAEANLAIFDSISALLVGLYILYSAYVVAVENIDFLMGKAPESAMHHEIRESARRVEGVVEVEDIRAHYVGTFIHVELTARVHAHLPTRDSHAIAEDVRHSVEEIPAVGRAFVHIEPFEDPSAKDSPMFSPAESPEGSRGPLQRASLVHSSN
ncbi:cation diffusion facilitator family transporter [bacterium]|nr:cation diffusion facilitator family transporter [bacterium]